MKRIFIACTCIALLLSAAPAFSQLLTSNITARAEDASGAVVPGVEVTVSSPAMIGGARTEVTDETGQYRFTLLPPGVYKVSFALPGFKTLTITDTTLTGGFTATVVGKMEVASTAEEVTVSSQAPTIDLEAATIGVNISQKMMDELPWSRSLTGMSMMIPGVRSTSFDIGNSNFGTSSTIAASSGGRSGGNVVMIDGLVWCQTYSDYGTFEEMNVSTNAKGADQMNSGITVGMVVKSGGNQFHGNATAKYQNGSMQSNNITNYVNPITGQTVDLVKSGYPVGSNKYTHFDDFYGDIGGPIMKDKFWFYFAHREGYQGEFRPGFRTAVGGELTDFYTKLRGPSAKFTYQISAKQKLEAYMGYPDKYQPFRNAGPLTPKVSTQDQDSWSSQGPMLTYTNIINSKTTFAAKITRGGYWWPGYTYGYNDYPVGPNASTLGPTIFANGKFQRIPTLDWLGVKNVGVRISDTTTGAVDGAFNSNYARPIRWQDSADLSRFATIRGKNHELKTGYLGWWDKDYSSNFGYPYYQAYIYRSTADDLCYDKAGVVVAETCSNLFKTPYRVTATDQPNKVSDGALYRSAYFNDKITWNRRLTVNVGLRYDWAGSFLPAQGNTGENPYSTAFVIGKRQNYVTNADGSKAEFPTYNLWSPRLSFAYDMFGNGRIALKGSFGRYIGITSGVNSTPGPGENSSGVNPIATNSCTYTNWDGTIPFDLRKNAGPDGITMTSDDLNLNGSCGKLKKLADGAVVPLTTYNFDKNLKPSYVSEYTGGIEIGLNKDYSVRFAIQRKFDRNGSKTLNVNTPYSAYTAITFADDPGRDGLFCSTPSGQTAKFSAPSSRTAACTGGVNYDADNNPFGRLAYYSVPTDLPNRTVTNQLFAARDYAKHEGYGNYTGMTWTFSKGFSHRWQAVTSYDLDFTHSVNTIPDTPNGVISNALSTQTQWNNTFKVSGIYSVPDIPLLPFFKLSGLQYSSSFITQNGDWYGRTAQINDIRGSAQTINVENRWGRFPRLHDWDQTFRYKHKLGETKQTIELTWELFNSLNANTLRSWRSTTTGNSNYLQPDGVSALRPGSILAPRIYEWGIAYKF